MEFRIISSRVKVNSNEQSGAKVVFFEDDGRSRCTVFLKFDDTVRDLIRQLEAAISSAGPQ